MGSGGLSVIGGDTINLVGLGGCNPEDFVSVTLPGYCARRVLRNPTVWLGIFTGGYVSSISDALAIQALMHHIDRFLTVLLMIYRVKGALLLGIFLTSIISWPRPTAVTYFPHNSAGDDLFNFFKQVVTFHPLQHTGNALDVGAIWDYCIISLRISDIIL